MSLATSTTTLAVAGITIAAALTACADDPRYVDNGDVLVANAAGTMDTGTVTATIDLPIRLEEEDELADRQALAAELGVEVPYVKADDLKVSVEWSIVNRSDERGTATVFVNGATEFAAYVPQNFVIDPDEDEEPPPLMGGVPLILEGGETRSGVFREEQILEGSIDLELMYRAAYNPFAAVLEQNMTTTEIVDGAGATVPADVFASMIRFDIVFSANREMALRYSIRVRDQRGILHDKLLNPDDPAELTAFAPVDIMPPMAPMMP